jgi:hypothetical protein
VSLSYHPGRPRRAKRRKSKVRPLPRSAIFCAHRRPFAAHPFVRIVDPFLAQQPSSLILLCASSTPSSLSSIFPFLAHPFMHIVDPFSAQQPSSLILYVTAPILRVPEEGTLGVEKHLEAHLGKLLEGRWCKGFTFGGFQATSPSPLSLGSLVSIYLLVCSPYAMALHQSMSLSVHSSAQTRLRLQPVSSLNSSSQMYVSDYLTSYITRLRNLPFNCARWDATARASERRVT